MSYHTRSHHFGATPSAANLNSLLQAGGRSGGGSGGGGGGSTLPPLFDWVPSTPARTAPVSTAQAAAAPEPQQLGLPSGLMDYLMPAVGAWVAWNAAKSAIKVAAITGVVWYFSQPKPTAPTTR